MDAKILKPKMSSMHRLYHSLHPRVPRNSVLSSAQQGGVSAKSSLTMAWTAEDPSAFELASKIARTFGARLIGLEPPSYGVMSMAWADAGMGAPIGGGLAEDAEERQRVAAVKQAFEQRASGLQSEWRSADDSGPTAIGVIGRAYDMIVMPQPGSLPKMPESVFETALFPIWAGRSWSCRRATTAWSASAFCSHGMARLKVRGRSRFAMPMLEPGGVDRGAER